MKNNRIGPKQLDAFENYLRREERAQSTIESYLRSVREFMEWLQGTEVTKDGVIRWKQSLSARGCQPATVNVKLVALNCFFTFVGWEQFRVKTLRLQKSAFRKTEKELTKEEYLRLVETAIKQGRKRLALLMETICAAGLRVSEVRYITVEAAQKGRAEIAMKGKIRTILLPGKLCRKLLKYAQKQKIASGEIFITRSGRSMSRRQIWGEMKSVCESAGVTAGKVFPHNLRHLFARTFYRVCRDIVKLADILGHSSVETTRIYLAESGVEHLKNMELLRLVC